MTPLVMIAEDDDALRAMLRYNLDKNGYHVVEAHDGEEALTLIQERAPDLLILDWMMPTVSGIEICRRLRGRNATRNLPIIMVTARGGEADRIRGLNTGADDYLTKPFSVSELMARIKAVLRRIRPALVDEAIEIGDITLDYIARRVHRAGREIALGPREFTLLAHLMGASGRVFSRAQLLDTVWGQEMEIEERTVDVHIGRLRKSLKARGEADPIRTVRSAGYAFDENYGKRNAA